MKYHKGKKKSIQQRVQADNWDKPNYRLTQCWKDSNELEKIKFREIIRKIVRRGIGK